MRQPYPSDVSRERFETIREFLESTRKITKPRAVDLYDVFRAVLYVLKEGCRWRSLPRDFPKWNTCYFYFQIWPKEDASGRSVLDRVLKNLSDSNGKKAGVNLTQQW